MQKSKKDDPCFKPPEKPFEHKGLSFAEAKELVVDAFTGKDMHAWYLLNMAVAQDRKEWVKEHEVVYVEAGINSTIFSKTDTASIDTNENF